MVEFANDPSAPSGPKDQIREQIESFIEKLKAGQLVSDVEEEEGQGKVCEA